jgi:TRAP-type C4-dicarboxylate transport system permease small subunit
MDKAVRNFLKSSETVLNYVTMSAIVAMVLLVFINVLLRYVFKFAITWSEELAVNLFVWVIFMGAILAMANNMHIAVDVFVKMAPKKAQKILSLIANSLVLVALYILVDGGYKVTLVVHKTISAATGLPFSFITVSMVISGVVMALIVLYQMYLTVRSLIHGEK